MGMQTENLLESVEMSEHTSLEEELNSLVETTMRLEHELELVIRFKDL